MAAPHVSGVVALAFQNNPTLDAIQVRQMLIDSARDDTHTGAVPNASWGYGKVNALGAASDVPSETNNEIPAAFTLYPTYPNPFNPEEHAGGLKIMYEISGAVNVNNVRVLFYDLLGREVRRISAGTEMLFWDGRDGNGDLLGSGIYFFRIEAGEFAEEGKILIVR